MTAQQLKEGIGIATWIAWITGAAVYTAGALIFLYTTFVTADYQGKFENNVTRQLERVENKVDKLLQTRGK